MGKHRTPEQDQIFLKFMEKHPDIANGNTRNDKLMALEGWKKLTALLNAAGPPCKTSNEWRRVWKDWKINIKKKIAQNRKVGISNGRRGKNEPISPTEDALAVVTNLYARVAVAKAEPFEADISIKQDNTDIADEESLDEKKFQKVSEESNDETAETVTSNRSETEYEPANHNRSSSSRNFLGALVNEEMSVLKKIVKELKEVNSNAKASSEAFVEMGEQITALMKQQLEESQRHNTVLEKLLEKLINNDT